MNSRVQQPWKLIGTKESELPQDWFDTPTWPPFMTSCAYALYWGKKFKGYRIFRGNIRSDKTGYRVEKSLIFETGINGCWILRPNPLPELMN